MKKFFVLLVSCILIFVIFPSCVSATAGGHGGGNSGGSSRGGSSTGGRSSGNGGLGIVGRSRYRSNNYGYYDDYGYRGSSTEDLLEELLFAGVIGSLLIRKRHQKAKEEKEASRDFLAAIPGNKKEKWLFLKNIEKQFIAIQVAWNNGDIDKVKDFYTKNLYEKHCQLLEENKIQGISSHTKKIQVQGWDNYRSIGEDSFSIQINFKCVDYEEELATGKVLTGNKNRRQYFAQVWYFNYDSSKKLWQADFIQPITG